MYDLQLFIFENALFKWNISFLSLYFTFVYCAECALHKNLSSSFQNAFVLMLILDALRQKKEELAQRIAEERARREEEAQKQEADRKQREAEQAQEREEQLRHQSGEKEQKEKEEMELLQKQVCLHGPSIEELQTDYWHRGLAKAAVL